MVLVREFTSIFISTRRQLFTLAAGVANHSTNLPEYEGAIKWSDDGVSFGKGKNRERITYVWEKTGGFVAQKRRPIIISHRDTPF